MKNTTGNALPQSKKAPRAWCIIINKPSKYPYVLNWWFFILYMFYDKYQDGCLENWTIVCITKFSVWSSYCNRSWQGDSRRLSRGNAKGNREYGPNGTLACSQNRNFSFPNSLPFIQKQGPGGKRFLFPSYCWVPSPFSFAWNSTLSWWCSWREVCKQKHAKWYDTKCNHGQGILSLSIRKTLCNKDFSFAANPCYIFFLLFFSCFVHSLSFSDSTSGFVGARHLSG